MCPLLMGIWNFLFLLKFNFCKSTNMGIALRMRSKYFSWNPTSSWPFETRHFLSLHLFISGESYFENICTLHKKEASSPRSLFYVISSFSHWRNYTARQIPSEAAPGALEEPGLAATCVSSSGPWGACRVNMSFSVTNSSLGSQRSRQFCRAS